MMTPPDEQVFDYRATEFVLVVLGAAMTVVALVVGVLLYRAGLREHRAQLERERIERERGDGVSPERRP